MSTFLLLGILVVQTMTLRLLDKQDQMRREVDKYFNELKEDDELLQEWLDGHQDDYKLGIAKFDVDRESFIN